MLSHYNRGVNLNIYNIQGELLKNQVVNSGNNQVEISALPKGTYLVQLITKESLQSTKLLKK